MAVLIFLLVSYALTSFMLQKVFAKAGVATHKALIPGLNFVEWTKIVGQPAWKAVYMLVPVVNIFYYAGLKVDIARAFGKFSFWDSVVAVVAPWFTLWQIGKNDKAEFTENIVGKEQEYINLLNEARDKKDTFALQRLQKSPFWKSNGRDWADSIIFAVFAAAFIRMFFFEMFVIPTSSMEGSLLVGDYLAVSKMSYGMRTPMTVLQVPLLHNQIPFLGTESYLTEPSLPYARLNPLGWKVERNEPVVFNWPAGDSVYYISPTYALTPDAVRVDNTMPPIEKTMVMSKMIARPIDKRDHYIKRCVGLPNDVLEIKDGQIYINGAASPVPAKRQFIYKISGNYNINTLQEWGVSINDVGQGSARAGIFNLSDDIVAKLKAQGTKVEKIDLTKLPTHNPLSIFPSDTAHFKWSVDNFGPLQIPAQGATVELKPETIELYSRIIRIYEHNTLERKGDKFYINGAEATSYTFKQNYYWMMGDNRHNSQDSRYWGFVPEDHLVGRPIFIWMSSGETGIRWNRIFTSALKM